MSSEKRSKDDTTPMFNEITGQEALMEGLTDFCDQYNLNKGAMSQLLKGIRKSHKGWVVKQ